MARNDDAHGRAADAAPPAPAAPASTNAERLPETESRAWIDGTFAGLSGAAVIAVFFLGVDLAEGTPLRTPGALGAAIFLGRLVEPGAEPVLAVVFGYTVLHGVMFMTAGVVASVALVGRTRPLGPLSSLTLAASLFAGLELFFLALVALAAPQLIGDFGAGRIATANLLAAGMMAVVLLRPRHEPISVLGRPAMLAVPVGLALGAVFLVQWVATAYLRSAQ